MKSKVEQLINDEFNGVVLVKKEGVKRFEQAFGYRDIPNEIANQFDTKFATASAGKVFVAVGILQLVEQGKLKLTDTIGQLLAIDWKQINPNITVEQLLTHTSGIPDYFDEAVMDDYADLWKELPNYKIRTSMDLLPLFINKEMAYAPGEKFKYNNTGFVVLGLIIEAIEKVSFDVYLQGAVFNLVGMEDTGYYELDRLPRNCANNYIWDEDNEVFYTNIFSVDVKGTGAGGAFTTASDIEKFWENLFSGKLLTQETITGMMSIQASDDEDNYGYGIWLTDTQDNNPQPYFEGFDPGVSFFSFYDRKTNLMMVAISNTGDDVWNMGSNIKKEMSK